MSANPKVAMAFTAMKAIGISEKKVKPVLKKLLKLYDKNWALIEDENYRALADAIFEAEENKGNEKKKKVHSHHDDDDGDDCGPPLKRLRLKHREEQASPSGETSSRRPKLKEADLQQSCSTEEILEPFQPYLGEGSSENETVISPKMHLSGRNQELSLPRDFSRDESEEPTQLHLRKKRSEPEPVSSHTHFRDKGKEPLVSPGNCHRNEREEPTQLCIRENRAESLSISPCLIRSKRNEPISVQLPPKEKQVVFGGSTTMVCLKEPKVEPGVDSLPKENITGGNHNGLISPKTEPCTDDVPLFEVPIAVIHPPPNPDPTRNEDPVHEDGNNSNEKADGVDSLASQDADVEKEGRGGSGAACEDGTRLELADIPEASPASVEIASSTSGEVKISLSCNYAIGQPNFHMPSPGAVLKMVEDKCLKPYKIIEPNFSLANLMKELCQCFLDLASDSAEDKQENFIRIRPNLDLLKKSLMENSVGAKCDDQDTFHIPASSFTGSLNFHSSTQVVPQVSRLLVLDGMDDLHATVKPNEKVLGNTNGEMDKRMEQKDPGYSSSSSFVAVRHERFTPNDTSPLHDVNDVRPLHDVNDISKGEECVRISVVNEVSSEPYPPLFFYIPRNIIFSNAYVKFSLAKIGDEDCCSNCFGDCMSSSIPCACARETGGDFAYTLEGLLKENFLDECISMNRDPQQNHLSYCKNCPLERCKNGDLSDPCKGHLVRKFIKECWSKCGCNKQCGNRVVQRGITCNLQVFLTAEGKGWGLRTLEDLPRGTFVCEYVGEILTNMELYERNMEINDGERQTSPVLLDAAWGSECVLKDREALCLDATFYGNVARFINHRCFDANLIEIPVEVETPNHRYYHLAFFTTRNIEALEELTWDYGIDFDDHNRPVKPFRCLCGSRCCRDMKRSHKTKLNALILK